MRCHLVILAKAPRLGRVKTRLARDIGMVPAGLFYRRTLGALIRRVAADPRWQTWLYLDGDGPALGPPSVLVRRQARGGLGPRMMQAMAELPPGPVVLIGGDIPDANPAAIARAFAALGRRALVFGPARDGGFWLVGMSRRPRIIDPYDGVAWSQPDTLAQILRGHPGAVLVDHLTDVDDGPAYHGRGPHGDPEGRRNQDGRVTGRLNR